MSNEQRSVVTTSDVNTSAYSPPTQATITNRKDEETADGHKHLPTVPPPVRSGRSAEIILPRWIYIRDNQGRYLSYRTTPQSANLTFRSGAPDIDSTFETSPRPPSRFQLIARNGNRIVGWGDRWYNAEPREPAGIPTFLFILARENVVYMQDNYGPSRFISNQLNSSGSPLGRSFINQDSEMEINIAAVKTEIVDVVYNINGAQVREAAPLIALSTSVRNDSDGEATQTLTYTYEKWSVGTWNNTAGVEVGVTTTFKVGVPFISSAQFEISVTASYSHEWGGEEGVRQVVTSSTTVHVPPRKKARARIIVRNAQIDVGFTYVQRVLWSNGTSQDTRLTGIYNNVDSWHVDVELDNWEDV